jgi:hypothetical protein
MPDLLSYPKRASAIRRSSDTPTEMKNSETTSALPNVPEILKPIAVRDMDGIPVVVVAGISGAGMPALKVTSRASAYRAGDWVIKSAARIPARDEYRRNRAAFDRKAPIAEPVAIVQDQASGHEFLAERFIEGTTLAAQFLDVVARKDSKAFDQLYARIRGPYEALAQRFFVELALAADLKLSNVFETSKGLVATDAWLADCRDRKLKHFSEYHPERTFSHIVLQLADAAGGPEYRAVHDWLTEQIVRLDGQQADNIRRYSKKLAALRATYGLL